MLGLVWSGVVWVRGDSLHDRVFALWDLGLHGGWAIILEKRMCSPEMDVVFIQVLEVNV